MFFFTPSLSFTEFNIEVWKKSLGMNANTPAGVEFKPISSFHRFWFSRQNGALLEPSWISDYHGILGINSFVDKPYFIYYIQELIQGPA